MDLHVSYFLDEELVEHVAYQREAVDIVVAPEFWVDDHDAVVGWAESHEPWVVIQHPQALEMHNSCRMMHEVIQFATLREDTEAIVVDLDAGVESVVDCSIK